MKSKVYFIDMRATPKENFPAKLRRLMETAGMADVIAKKDLTAVKIHFGELGNTAYIRPVYVRKIVETIKDMGGTPFLTDSNTLYAGTRSDSPHHLVTAIRNGFAYSVVEAPLVIADGLRGRTETAVRINRKRFKDVFIGTEVVEADALISVAHFKGHELSGFGGAIKNLGMGCASRKGKLAQHSGLSPKVIEKKCKGCGECIVRCSQKALSLVEKKANIDQEKCIGCGECILMCEQGAIQIQWNKSIPEFMENMVEYTMGVLENKSGKVFNINFITDVSPACDCMPVSDAPIVANIGVCASADPVAIDQACVDLVNGQHAAPGSCLTVNVRPGEDKFKGLYPKVDWELQLIYAQKLGLGTRNYELVEI